MHSPNQSKMFYKMELLKIKKLYIYIFYFLYFFEPIKVRCCYKQYMFANHSNHDYTTTGKASLTFQIINQRADFSFALFSGGLQSVFAKLTLNLHFNKCFSIFQWAINYFREFQQPKLISASSPISFANPKAPLYPRLAQGKTWDEVNS